MKSFFENMLGWLSGHTVPAIKVGAAPDANLSDYDRRMKMLEKTSGRLFLP